MPVVTRRGPCTGHPIAAVDHCLEAFAQGKHVVNVTVEADAFCGPLLARRAAEAGVQYSLAFGDQPALICDLVDWARAAGFPVVAAGRGHKWLPHFCESTPETVWGFYGLTPEQAYCLLSVAANLRLAEVVNAPQWTVACEIPLDIFD